MLDFSFEAPATTEVPVLDGLPIIVSGQGCRLTIKTAKSEAGDNQAVLRRLYAVVQALTDAALPGFSTTPVDGYLRVHGGESPLYVKGEDQRGVITSIGKGIISAPESVKDAAASLGVTALVEW